MSRGRTFNLFVSEETYITAEGVAALLFPSNCPKIYNQKVWSGDLSCVGNKSRLATASCSQQTNLCSDNTIIADVTTLPCYDDENEIPTVTVLGQIDSILWNKPAAIWQIIDII